MSMIKKIQNSLIIIVIGIATLGLQPQPPYVVYVAEGAVLEVVIVDPYAILDEIAECESDGQQFNRDGSVLLGRKNPDDIGEHQINLFWWGDKAVELGFDIYTEEGNRAMAEWIIDHRGTQDWYLSAHCWDK